MSPALRFQPQNIVRGLFGALFCWAAVSKLGNQSQFFGDLLTYQLPLSAANLRAVVIVLPWLELLVGLMLLASFQLRAALGWCFVLFATFAVITGQAWARGLNISCGCFHLEAVGLNSMQALAGIIETAAFTFFRSLVLLALTYWLWRSLPPDSQKLTVQPV